MGLDSRCIPDTVGREASGREDKICGADPRTQCQDALQGFCLELRARRVPPQDGSRLEEDEELANGGDEGSAP